MLLSEVSSCVVTQGPEQQPDLGAAALRVLQPQQTRHPHRLLQQAAVRPGERFRRTQESPDLISPRKRYLGYSGRSFYRHHRHHPSVSRYCRYYIDIVDMDYGYSRICFIKARILNSSRHVKICLHSNSRIL